MPEFNKINVIKKLLNVKYNFAYVPVLDLADIVSVSSYYVLNRPTHFYFVLFILIFLCTNARFL